MSSIIILARERGRWLSWERQEVSMDSDAPAAAVLKAVSEAHPGAMVVIASQGPAVPPETP
jgi:hypothetical protein